MPVKGPDVTSPIFAISALGVKGGVRRRRERVVVWDFKRVVAAWIAARGPVGRSCAVKLFEVSVEGEARVWEKCASRVWVV